MMLVQDFEIAYQEFWLESKDLIDIGNRIKANFTLRVMFENSLKLAHQYFMWEQFEKNIQISFVV